MDENLVLLTLDLDLPNLWENELVKEFPRTSFTIKQAYPISNNRFSGLMNIEKGILLRLQII